MSCVALIYPGACLRSAGTVASPGLGTLLSPACPLGIPAPASVVVPAAPGQKWEWQVAWGRSTMSPALVARGVPGVWGAALCAGKSGAGNYV